MEKDSIIASVNIGEGCHLFELAETPKGVLEARIDGMPMSKEETKEMSMWLGMANDD